MEITVDGVDMEKFVTASHEHYAVERTHKVELEIPNLRIYVGSSSAVTAEVSVVDDNLAIVSVPTDDWPFDTKDIMPEGTGEQPSIWFILARSADRTWSLASRVTFLSKEETYDALVGADGHAFLAVIKKIMAG